LSTKILEQEDQLSLGRAGVVIALSNDIANSLRRTV